MPPLSEDEITFESHRTSKTDINKFIYENPHEWLLISEIKISYRGRYDRIELSKRVFRQSRYKWQVFEALNYLWYRFWIGANPFRRICPFHLYGICNQLELISSCVTGKKSQVFTSPICKMKIIAWTRGLLS